MKENIEILKEPLTSLKTQENFLMDSNEVTNLEIDLTTLGINFETFNVPGLIVKLPIDAPEISPTPITNLLSLSLNPIKALLASIAPLLITIPES